MSPLNISYRKAFLLSVPKACTEEICEVGMKIGIFHGARSQLIQAVFIIYLCKAYRFHVIRQKRSIQKSEQNYYR